jgi:oligopeptide/dipeptide ABC transporter ATP-binding protein
MTADQATPASSVPDPGSRSGPGSAPMIHVDGLVKHYRTRGRGTVHALDGISFTVAAGETLGLVGESGCGKSTTARLLVQLERPTSGRIVIGGQDLGTASRAQRESLHRMIQMVFQDPYASLDPRVRVGDAIGEVLKVHRLSTTAAARRERVTDLLDMVGLPSSATDRYPHELSGGQRQRVGIARALAVEPRVLVLDEAVSALDVSVRAEVMNLLARLRRELGLTYVFISHDLGMVRHIADRIAVMYLGQIVEIGPWQPVSDAPAHPYTVALQGAVPTADPTVESQRVRLMVSGEVPDAARPPAGCRFHPRCPLVEDVCRTVDPSLAVLGGPGGGTAPDADPTGRAHLVSCHVVRREGRGATALVASPTLGGTVGH